MKLFFTFYGKESIPKLHHFFEYYKKLGVTNFYAVYHTFDSDTLEVLDYVMKNAMVVKIWDGVFDERIKTKLINEVRLKFSKYGEWSFTVDCDEFVGISYDEIQTIVSSDFNYVQCKLIDRVSIPPLKTVIIDEDIGDTFPYYTHLTKDTIGGNTNKVSLSTREVIIGLGYHYVVGQSEQIIKLKRYPFNGYVNHYMWDGKIKENVVDRVNKSLIKDGSNDNYLIECNRLLRFDFNTVELIKKPLEMKLLFIVWSFQDLNLLKQFFNHYESLGVTKFYCIFHTYGMEGNIIYDYVSERAIIVHHWDEQYTVEWESRLKNKYKKEIADYRDEWIWCVDADEFVDITQEYIRELLESECNYVNGWLIDRFSEDGLVKVKNENIFSQFPVRTFYTRYVSKGSASKIPLTKSYVILGVGHHVVLNELYNYGVQDDTVLVPYNVNEEDWIEVSHIKWHYQLLEDIYNKFTKTMDICKHSARELGVFVLDYCYKKKSIIDIIKDVRL